MISISLIAEAASLLADPARANMLFALKDDGEITSGDLASVAGVAHSTASEHLSKLVEAGVVTVRAKGRKRYYRLAAPVFAEMLEGVEGVAATLAGRTGRRAVHNQAMAHARCCYDHLAGRLSVQVLDAMLAKAFIRHCVTGPELTDEGTAWLHSLGADVHLLRAEPRRFLRFCSDWSENALHVGGAVGAAMLRAFIWHGWLRRNRGSKVLLITPVGAANFRSHLGLDIGSHDTVTSNRPLRPT